MTSRLQRLNESNKRTGGTGKNQKKIEKQGYSLGIRIYTAIVLIVENKDFKWFAKENVHAAYLGFAQEE